VTLEENPVIENLSFKLKSGDLMIVVGAVGSGKTTLLHSVM
jgi:ABC-type cobalamin/Fe3+-siderophores transport system ATPase subunit